MIPFGRVNRPVDPAVGTINLLARMTMARKKIRKSKKVGAVLNPDAAGIDIGATEIYVAVPPDRDSEPVRMFASFTQDLHKLADWLQETGIRTVAMESTGVYWIPLM
jgi:hypothetical protein